MRKAKIQFSLFLQNQTPVVNDLQEQMRLVYTHSGRFYTKIFMLFISLMAMQNRHISQSIEL